MNRTFSSLAVFLIFMASPLLSLAEEIIQLAPIQVQGRAPVTSTLDQPMSQIPLSAQEVKDLPGTGDDPLKAVTLLPGANEAANGSGAVYMRGSSTEDNQYVLDYGIPVPYLYHYGGLFSLISQDVLSGFDVYPSNFPARYQSRLGGVIDIKLRDPSAQQWQHKLHVGTYDASYYGEGSLSDQDYIYANIRTSYIDLVLSGMEMDGVEFVQFPKFTDGIVRWQRKLDNGDITATVVSSYDDLALKIGDDADTCDIAALGDLTSHQDFTSVSLNYRSDLSEDWSQSTTVAYNEASNEFQIGTQQVTDPNPGQPYGFNYQQNIQYLKPTATWFINDDMDVTLGLVAERGSVKVDGYISAPPSERDKTDDTDLTSATKFTINETVDYSVYAPFAEWFWMQDNWEQNFGLRYTHFDGLGSQAKTDLSPRWNGKYYLSDDSQLLLGWGRYVQPAQGYELSESLGNPDLGFQVSEHRKVGFAHQLNTDWSGSLELYHKPMHNLVVEADTGNYSNAGYGEAKGIDLFIKRKPSKNRQAWIGYTYAESERTNPNINETRPFDGDQPHQFTFVWQAPFDIDNWRDGWRWGTKVFLKSGAPYTPVTGRTAEALPGETVDCTTSFDANKCRYMPIYAEQNSARLPTYFQVDLSFSKLYHYTNWDLEVKYEILNLSSLLYQNVTGYDYNCDYSNINNPDKVSTSFILPAASVTAHF